MRRLLLDGGANVLKGRGIGAKEPESLLKLEQRPATPQGAEDERPRPAELIMDFRPATHVGRGITQGAREECFGPQDGGASCGFRIPTATKKAPITAAALERSLQRHLV